MSDTYRPGDIAMVDGKPAVHHGPCDFEGFYVPEAWIYTEDGRVAEHLAEVGPVLGNVADIAAVPEGFDVESMLEGLLNEEYGDEGWRDLGSLHRIARALRTAIRHEIAKARRPQEAP